MTKNNSPRKAHKTFTAAFLVALALLPFTSSGAQAHDQRHGHGHGHDRDRDYNRHGQECTQIVQEFQVTDFLRYTETGVACRGRGGAWQIVSDTRYPNFYGQVYTIGRGGRIYIGEVSPRAHSYGNNHRKHDFYERDYNPKHREKPDFAYREQNNSKKKQKYEYRH